MKKKPKESKTKPIKEVERRTSGRIKKLKEKVDSETERTLLKEMKERPLSKAKCKPMPKSKKREKEIMFEVITISDDDEDDPIMKEDDYVSGTDDFVTDDITAVEKNPVTVENENLKECEFCSQKFDEDLKYRQHLDYVHFRPDVPKLLIEKSKGRIICELCDYRNNRRSRVREHFFKAHRVSKFSPFEKESVPCYHCLLDNVFHNTFSFEGNRIHMTREHEHTSWKSQCELCLARFINNFGLELHMKSPFHLKTKK